VLLQDQSVKSMRDLNVGDRVSIGNGIFSEVFMFTHRSGYEEAEFHVLETVTGHEIALTAEHYMYTTDMQLMSAASFQIGDDVILDNGVPSRVVSIRKVQMVGLYNPQTLHGDIVVNGVRASTYTQAFPASYAHAALAMFRIFYSLFGTDPTAGLFEVGTPKHISPNLLPRGKPIP
jgi:hypothetical protein